MRLSNRERQVLVHTAQGKDILWISKHLRLSRHTIKHHRYSAYSKLGVSTAAHAVAAAIFDGQITEEEWLT